MGSMSNEHIEQLRQVIADQMGVLSSHLRDRDADAILAATYPPACQTCRGTGYKPKPDGWDQLAHLESGTCDCHDSWGQCDCEHRTPDCGCCPGGTGLCGPLPCPDCPTIADLLAWGVAVATAERAPGGEGMIAPVYSEGYNDRLDSIRAVKP